MSKICRIVRNKVPQGAIHRTALKKNGCSLDQEGLPKDRLVIDLDKCGIKGHLRRADFLFVSEHSGGGVIPIEMKRGAPKATQAVQQLQAGAQVAESWIKSENVENFCALLVAGCLPRAESGKLRKMGTVRFGNKVYRIQFLKCGSPLRKVVNW